ncbi:ribokinase [Aaosphaeria arxii CBS 175.79]|uniref:Ribokinase n=1 Tax=Aaosphaeria arxii CBS 175.79 TaxID=1450172 RepID=A0A6A5XS55_9PLEO|nr:ribokinase [Aaosphaeria arxii CBS 175.79]KAF2015739.1 ribokinase [Aaosphaeria arxii CBS 175.79]
MAPQVIAVIGSLMANMMMVTDRIPDGGETIMALEYIELLGGKGCNAAVAAYRTSHKRPTEIALPKLKRSDSFQDVRTSSNGDIEVRMIGAIGDDHLEKKFKKVLQEDHVDISGLVTVPNTRSSVCFVLIENATRENRILVTPNALSYWKPHHFLRAEDLGNGIRPDLVVAQLEICKEAVEQMIETAGKAGIDFLLNAAPATPINPRTYENITHLIVNETEASILSGRSLDELCQETWRLVTQEFLDRGVKNVVLTLGEKGAYYATSDGHGHIPGFEVEVLDTTGAGDTFTGTYASDYLQQKAGGSWDIKSAILRANKAAALAVSKFGAQEGIPWLDEIEAFEAKTRY